MNTTKNEQNFSFPCTQHKPEKSEKPSVLGKLAAAKSQEKAPAAPGATKKKEDMQL